MLIFQYEVGYLSKTFKMGKSFALYWIIFLDNLLHRGEILFFRHGNPLGLKPGSISILAGSRLISPTKQRLIHFPYHGLPFFFC